MDEAKTPSSVCWRRANDSMPFPPECDRLGQALADLESAISMVVLEAAEVERRPASRKGKAMPAADKAARDCATAIIGTQDAIPGVAVRIDPFLDRDGSRWTSDLKQALANMRGMLLREGWRAVSMENADWRAAAVEVHDKRCFLANADYSALANHPTSRTAVPWRTLTEAILWHAKWYWLAGAIEPRTSPDAIGMVVISAQVFVREMDQWLHEQLGYASHIGHKSWWHLVSSFVRDDVGQLARMPEANRVPEVLRSIDTPQRLASFCDMVRRKLPAIVGEWPPPSASSNVETNASGTEPIDVDGKPPPADSLLADVHTAYANFRSTEFVVEVLPAANGMATLRRGEPQPSDLLRGGPLVAGGGGALAIMRDGKQYRFSFVGRDDCGSARDAFIELSHRVGARLPLRMALELGMADDAEPVAVWWMFMLRRLEWNPHFVVAASTYQAIVNPLGAMVQALKMLDDLPMLSPAASATYELLLEQPPHKGLLGPAIITELKRRNVYIEQSSLTSRIIPELGPYGIENIPRRGYRIPVSRRPVQKQH